MVQITKTINARWRNLCEGEKPKDGLWCLFVYNARDVAGIYNAERDTFVTVLREYKSGLWQPLNEKYDTIQAEEELKRQQYEKSTAQSG